MGSSFKANNILVVDIWNQKYDIRQIEENTRLSPQFKLRSKPSHMGCNKRSQGQVEENADN